MPLTAEEKVRIKYHLGYPLQETLRSMVAGLPTIVQSNWQIDAVLAHPLAEETIPLIRDHIKQLDEIIFGDLPDSRLYHIAEQLEELKLNMRHPKMLSDDYKFWQQRLAQILCVPVNPDFSGIGEVYGGGPRNFAH